MRKEVVFVVLVGIAIGVVVAFGIYIARQAISERQEKPPTASQESTTELPSDAGHSLIVSEPANESISEEETVAVIGTTTPGSVVTVIAAENEYLLTADEGGNFSADVALVGGANTITVSAFDEEGNRAEEVLTVVFSTEL